MARVVMVTGIDRVIAKMKVAKPKMGPGISRGLRRAGALLLRESQKIVPVHKGHLKGSAFMRNIGGMGWLTDIIVGYTAKYAVYVHEDLEKVHGKRVNIKYADEIASATTNAQKKYFFKRGEEQQAKFLEKPARLNRRKFLRILRQEANKV